MRASTRTFTRALALLFLLLSALWTGASQVLAQPYPYVIAQNQERSGPQSSLLNNAAQEEPRITRSQASDIARRAFPGRVRGIWLEDSIWRVRMDQDGTVFNVFVDGETGQVSRTPEQED